MARRPALAVAGFGDDGDALVEAHDGQQYRAGRDAVNAPGGIPTRSRAPEDSQAEPLSAAC
jgi:hypothetical protein